MGIYFKLLFQIQEKILVIRAVREIVNTEL